MYTVYVSWHATTEGIAYINIIARLQKYVENLEAKVSFAGQKVQCHVHASKYAFYNYSYNHDYIL